MSNCSTLLQELANGSHDQRLSQLYGFTGDNAMLADGRNRIIHVVEGFAKSFPNRSDVDVSIFSAPGRTEIGGNHTDHQLGCVLCASVNLDMIACAAVNDTSVITIHSEGYSPLFVDISDLSIQKDEENTSMALVRGIAAKISQMGYAITGMDVYMTSTVLGGSGLSSSAAYEILVGNLFNHFFCKDEISPIDLAIIGKYAENVYFGKPSGLMDQTASSVGSVVSIDFGDVEHPVVSKVEFDFASVKHALCIIDTVSDHADLTADYGYIPQEMCAVANFFGKEKLRQVDEAQFWNSLADLRKVVGDRAVVRAIHFFSDNRRAQEEAQSLRDGDFHTFLSLVNQSGVSSSTHLQNIWVSRTPHQQAVTLALAVGGKLLDGVGAIRVHGGGFAGTIQAFVPYDKLDTFKSGMEALLGDGTCHVLHIRPIGGCVVI